jgi:DNA processing protein
MKRSDVTADERDRLAWLALGALAGLAPREAFALVHRFGGAARARREAEALERLGGGFVTWDEPAYPTRLRAIPDPPPALAVRGALPPEEAAVAVVGARRASEYGRRIAETLARGLAEAGLAVVSGLAAGVDAAAHRGALAGGGRTIAVLGTGLDRVYPSWHAPLAAAVAAQGALVTEFACGTPPLAFHFPRRNRLISGLTLGTVVVEAAEESGSLITARYANEQGREVFAVPGPIGPAGHRGPHRLIQQGAKLVTRVEDVLEEIAPALAGRLAERRAAAAVAALTPEERRILAAVDAEGRHVDEVIRHAAVPAGPALETLLALELRGLVHQLPGKRFRRRAA